MQKWKRRMCNSRFENQVFLPVKIATCYFNSLLRYTLEVSFWALLLLLLEAYCTYVTTIDKSEGKLCSKFSIRGLFSFQFRKQIAWLCGCLQPCLWPLSGPCRTGLLKSRFHWKMPFVCVSGSVKNSPVKFIATLIERMLLKMNFIMLHSVLFMKILGKLSAQSS